jgi:RHS repeat-associated protein
MMMNLMYTLFHAEIHDDHGERVTVPQRRTGWLDRELDYETAPGHVRHKLYDLDHRKYDAASEQFLSVDPLWPMFISSGSCVYCTGDAVNNVDPWGWGHGIVVPTVGSHNGIAQRASAPMDRIVFAGTDNDAAPAIENAVANGFAAVKQVRLFAGTAGS